MTNEEKLESTVYFIEATSFEMHCLWKEHKENWVEDLSGFMRQVGRIDGDPNKPVNMTLSFAMLYGKRICFYDVCSRFNDTNMVNEYLRNILPKPVSMTDANNFHHVIHECRTIQPEPYYYPSTGWNGQDCSQRCMVKDDGVMIGSASCQECVYMVEMAVPYNEFFGPDWIICSRIEEATKNIEE